MNKTLILAALAAVVAVGTYYMTQMAGGPGTSTGEEAPTQGAAMVEVALPGDLSQQAQMGRQAFEAVCADCHGKNGAGKMGSGPPLIHKIYEPSHHGDMAFQMAVQNGVRAHHWKFGNMPPQEGLTKADVNAIVAYVREVQRVNGIQ